MQKVIIGSLVLLLPLFVNADDTTELSNLLKTYKTISGKFTQQLVDETGELIQDSTGEFQVKKPGYFHWETKQPFPQLLVSNLESIWLYDPDLEQVTVRSYKKNVDQSPALLLNGDVQKITENYRVRKATGESSRFILLPLNNQATFTELQLAFQDKELIQMVLKDSLQQTTTFNFSQLALNRNILDTAFEFIVPEGVDILVDE